MSQISPPIRIVLVIAVVFMAAWFTVLKPKEVEVPADPGASVSSKAGEFQAKAKAGAAAAERDAAGAANATLEDGTPGSTAVAPTTGAPTGTAPDPTATTTRSAKTPPPPPLAKKDLAELPRSIRGPLKSRKVLVLGVLNTEAKPWAPMADDDRFVRSALRDVNRYRGDVAIRTAPVAKLARYEGLLNALAVQQTPTIVVVDRNRRAVALTGYADVKSINQAIADARRGSTEVLIKDKFLARVNAECGRMNVRFSRFSLPTVRGAELGWITRLTASQGRYRRAFASIPAPAKWRGLKSQIVSRLGVNQARLGRLRDAVRSRRAARIDAALVAIATAPVADLRALDRRFNALGLTACAINRTQ